MHGEPEPPLKIQFGNIIQTIRDDNAAREVLKQIRTAVGVDIQESLQEARVKTHLYFMGFYPPFSLTFHSHGTGTHLWFDDSPDTGHPDCLCSACYLPIPDSSRPILRMWSETDPVLEMRFHHQCTPREWGFRLPADEEEEL